MWISSLLRPEFVMSSFTSISISNSSINFFFFPCMVRVKLSCDYNEIKRRYCHCIAVRWGGRVASIQGIEGGSLLLLLVLAFKRGRCRVFPS